jgi:hypothetical protein
LSVTSRQGLGAEFETPEADGFIRDRDEEILNISKAQTETVVQPDGVVDDFGWKSISAVARRVASSFPATVRLNRFSARETSS